MEHKYKSCRRGPALAAAAAFGLATTAMLAPAAHADTGLDRLEESASTAVVADVEEVTGAIGDEAAVETGSEAVAETGDEDAAGTGDEAAVETGSEAVAETGDEDAAGTGDEAVAETGDEDAAGTGDEVAPETGDELLGDTEAAPAEAEEADETAVAGNSEQDDLCIDGAVDGAAGEQQVPEAGTADEGTGEAGLSDAATTGEGTVTTSDCEGTTPGQVEKDPVAGGGNETPLPVGGVDAGMGEAASQNMVLPIAAAGVAAAAIGLGAYTLVRRSRNNA